MDPVVPDKKPYRLTFKPLPRAGRRVGIYERAIADFADSGQPSARVEFDGRSTDTAYAGLLHALKVSARDDVVVRRREGTLWLVRADTDAG